MAGTAADPDLHPFEENRRYLLGLAYRMLGSIAEAEDIVQEAWIRWQRASGPQIGSPRAFLRKVTTRLCLDHLKSARVRREEYVGPWLPEPVAGDLSVPDHDVLLARDLTMALLLALERLSPAQRAAFLLHDVFGVPFAEISETLGKTEPACRQLAARARRQVRDSRQRFEAESEEAERLAATFLDAVRSGDVDAFKRLLAEDVMVHTDGGGVRPAALNLIFGRERAIRLFIGLRKKQPGRLPEIVYRGTINSSPGVVSIEPDGAAQATLIEAEGGRISAIYVIRNPGKLRPLLEEAGISAKGWVHSPDHAARLAPMS